MVQALNPTRRTTGALEVERWAEQGPFRQVRVLVAEPRSLVRDAYRSLIEGSDSYAVVGEDIQRRILEGVDLEWLIVLFECCAIQ